LHRVTLRRLEAPGRAVVAAAWSAMIAASVGAVGGAIGAVGASG
jgi:hypothetical protein